MIEIDHGVLRRNVKVLEKVDPDPNHKRNLRKIGAKAERRMRRRITMMMINGVGVRAGVKAGVKAVVIVGVVLPVEKVTGRRVGVFHKRGLNRRMGT